MKQKLVIIATALTLVLSGVPEAGAQWVNIDFPWGETTFSFAVASNYIFAGTGGGVYSSTNNGSVWTVTEGEGLTLARAVERLRARHLLSTTEKSSVNLTAAAVTVQFATDKLSLISLSAASDAAPLTYY